ncbi:TetR/AcrR family transcriptional regulator [Nocardia sp. NPDC059691]|uniref:TetR/AcrR family transcriptional regulator n=1 Tax=Nocardia sp. NPDC059691 TaxID=3346908 RepID=UPI0036B125FD
MGSKRRAAADTREYILAVARELFYQHGIRATGVDRVAAEANVAPPTLYRLFGSKDDLVAAYLEREEHRYREWFRAAEPGRGPVSASSPCSTRWLNRCVPNPVAAAPSSSRSENCPSTTCSVTDALWR